MVSTINLLSKELGVLQSLPLLPTSYATTLAVPSPGQRTNKTTSSARRNPNDPLPLRSGMPIHRGPGKNGIKSDQRIPRHSHDNNIFEAISKGIAGNKRTWIRHSVRGNIVLLTPRNVCTTMVLNSYSAITMSITTLIMS